MALTPSEREAQYRTVYAGICAVAAHCDGALSLDGVGFNGQDTLFGKRIAAVPFEAWTEAVKTEAARIALTYKVQILNYIGIDVATLDVVREARGLTTVYAARNDARTYERRQKGASKIDERKVDVDNLGKMLLVKWVKGDPDFGALLDGVRALPSRQYAPGEGGWLVALSDEAIAFVNTWDLPLTPAAQRLIENYKVAPKVERFNVTLEGTDKVRIEAPYDPARVQAARELPGRRWNGAQKVDIADLTPQVLTFAARFGLKIDPAVPKALDALQATKIGAQTVSDMLAFASRQASPENLPPAFEALVMARRAR